jgi:hypothetical protein
VTVATAAGVRALLDREPFGPRDDAALLAELNALTRFHLAGCPPYARVWPGFEEAATIADLPYLHATVFKHVALRTQAEGIVHGRQLNSSSTSGQQASQIALDGLSSELQGESTRSILRAFVGEGERPLVVLDSPRSLRGRALSARLAAAMALRPLATDLHLVLERADDPASVRWEAIEQALEGHDRLLVYGFTWILWQAWGAAELPESLRERLRDVRIDFVHSGGWKKLEALAVDRERFDAALLRHAAPGSSVVDYYGLVEQVGVVFPLCEAGARHAPVWAEVVVRDPWTLAPLGPGEQGQLQLLNPLARGGPYHSVLTEDLGTLLGGPCPCGRQGRRFTLDGRVPKAEVRGCANV